MTLRHSVSSAPSKIDNTRASTKSRLTGYSSANAASSELVSAGGKVRDAAASKKQQADVLALALLADARLRRSPRTAARWTARCSLRPRQP